MKFLIFANKIDTSDDIMGFLPSWVGSISCFVESIIVVAQYQGDYSPPENVRVMSIHKEHNTAVLKRIFLYWKILFQERKNYDAVFVIMAPFWVIVSWPLSFLLRKKLYLWYAVWKSSFKLKFAHVLVDKIFTSVSTAFPFKTNKVIAIGQSINTQVFIPDEKEIKRGRILFLGRISPVKRIEVLISALTRLKNQPIELVIAGDIARPSDALYLADLKKLIAHEELNDTVKWLGKIPYSQVPTLFQTAEIVVNLTVVGSFDKTILEAMASGAIIIVSNPALREFLPSDLIEFLLFREGDGGDLGEKIKKILALPDNRKKEIRTQLRYIVERHHSLDQWTNRLIKNL